MRRIALSRSLALLPVVLTAACTSGPYLAPYGSTVSLAKTELSTTAGLYCDTEPDYTGGTLINYAQVISGISELPMENTEVTVLVDAVAGIYVLPQEAIKTVDFPAADAEVTNQGDVEAACVDENGNFDNTNEWCAWYWDEDSAQYYQFGEDYADADGYAPTYFKTSTDNRGIITIFMFLDCIYGDSTLRVDIGVDNDTMTISAE